MPIRRIKETSGGKGCIHPGHEPPRHIVIKPGTILEHECPGCKKITILRLSMNQLEQIEQYKKDRPNYWIAHVESPQMGTMYSNDFESNSVSKILEQIIEGLDLTEADFINIAFTRKNP